MGDLTTTVRLEVEDKEANRKLTNHERLLQLIGKTAEAASKTTARGSSLQEQQFKQTEKAAEAFRKKLDGLETKSATFGLKGVERLKAQQAEFLRLGRTLGATTTELDRVTSSYGKMIARAEKATSKGVGGFRQGADGLATNARNFAAAAGLTVSVGAAIGLGKEAVQEAARVEQLGIALRELEGKLGKARGELSGAAGAVKELGFTSRQSRELVLALSTAGVGLSTQMQLAAGALDAASRTGQTLDYTIARISQGVPKLSGEITEELGVVVRLNDATKAYAQTLGLANDQHLTAEQRVQAFAEALGGKLQGAAGTYSATMGTLARRLQDINQEQAGTREALGNLIAPQVLQTAKTYGAALEGIKSTLEFLQVSGWRLRCWLPAPGHRERQRRPVRLPPTDADSCGGGYPRETLEAFKQREDERQRYMRDESERRHGRLCGRPAASSAARHWEGREWRASRPWAYSCRTRSVRRSLAARSASRR